MKIKKFTLIELITVIVTLSILLAIILISVNDFKKKSVNSAVSSNTRIFQSAVDTYYLKYGKYPVKSEVSLAKPKFIDIDELVDKGLVKKDLDLSKVKSQLYWVDVFGRTWGATDMPPKSVNVIQKKDKKIFEFTLTGDIERYNIYEVSNYKGANISYKEIEIQVPKENVAFADSKKTTYRLVKSEEVVGGGPTVVAFETTNLDSIYLVSTEDYYGLESAPYGLEENHFFKPLIDYEGEREYEIEGDKTMYWIDYYGIENKPVGTTIEYSFKVKDKNGVYGEFTDDFYSLPPSKGIIAKVKLTAIDKKNKPSLYDLRIFYNTDEEDVRVEEDIDLIQPDDPNDRIKKEKGERVRGDKMKKTPEEREKEEKEKEERPDRPKYVCPKGYGKTNVKSDGSKVDPSQEKQLSYLFKIKEDEMIDQITNPKIEDAVILDTIIQYALMNTSNAYTHVDYISDIPENSCVNVLYVIQVDKPISIERSPWVKTKKPVDKKEIIKEDKDKEDTEKPDKDKEDKDKEDTEKPDKDKEDNDKENVDKDKEIDEWTIVDQIRFSGNSRDGTEVLWTGFEKSDVIPENTRIRYKFSQTAGSKEYDNITELPKSKTATATAYLEVKTVFLNDENQEEPEVTRMKLIHEGGHEIVYPEEEFQLPQYDINFYESTNGLLNKEMMYFFDYNPDTSASLRMEGYRNNSIIKWQLKEGVSFPTNLQGKVLKVTLSVNSFNAIRLQVVDKSGNPLSFHMFDEKLGTVSKDSIEAGMVKTDYLIILPKDAEGIRIENYGGRTPTLNLYDIQFAGIYTEVDEITNIQFQPKYDSISMSWTKPENVESVEVYRNGVFIGTTTGSTFKDPAILSSNTTYNYSFIVKNKFGVTKWMASRSVATVARQFEFYEKNYPSRALEFAAFFDKNAETVSKIKITNKDVSPLISWRENSGHGQIPDLTGKRVRLQAHNSSVNAIEVTILDSNGNRLSFTAYEDNGDYKGGTSFILDRGTKTYYTITMPAGAAGIKFTSINGKTHTLNLTDIYLLD